MSTSRLSPMVRTLLAGVTLAGAAAALPARAQDYQSDPVYYPDTQEDIVVEGRWGRLPNDIDTLSQRVSYADLDLSRSYDRRVLRGRIDDSATFLCDRMDESDDNFGVVPSCRTAAYQDGVHQARYVEGFARRGEWDSPARSRYTGNYPACTSYRHDNCVEVYTY